MGEIFQYNSSSYVVVIPAMCSASPDFAVQPRMTWQWTTRQIPLYAN